MVLLIKEYISSMYITLNSSDR